VGDALEMSLVDEEDVVEKFAAHVADETSATWLGRGRCILMMRLP
jgi:hypothetical protein